MMRIQLIAALMGGFFLSASAYAETLCGWRQSIAATLQEDYAENPVGYGLNAAGRLIELFVSNDGSFSILVTTSTGHSCIVAVGQEWTSATALSTDLPLFREQRH